MSNGNNKPSGKISKLLIGGGILSAIVAAIVTFILPIIFEYNKPPVAVINSSKTVGEVPFDIVLDAVRSWDSDGEIIGYEWKIEDERKNDCKIEYTISKTKTYNIVLTVTDNEGKTDQDSINIIGNDAMDEIPPTISLYSPQDGLKTHKSCIEVNGNVFDANKIESVYVNDIRAIIKDSEIRGSDFTSEVPLILDKNLIRIIAKDQKNNVSEHTINILRFKNKKKANYFAIINSCDELSEAKMYAKGISQKSKYVLEIYKAKTNQLRTTYAVTLGGYLTAEEANKRVAYAKQNDLDDNGAYKWKPRWDWGDNLCTE